MPQDPYAEFQTPQKTAAPAAPKAATGDPYAEFQTAPKTATATAPAAKQPGLLDTANSFYNAPAASGEGMLSRIGRSFGRTAMMPVNLASSIVSPADEEEKKQGFTGVKQFGPLQAHRLVVAPSNQTETMLEDQETKDAAKGMPHSAVERWGNRAVNSIPILGPAIINEGQRAGSGDIAGAVTDVGTAIALPHVMKEAMPGGALPGARPAGATAFPATNAVVRGAGKVLQNPYVAHSVVPAAVAGGAELLGIKGLNLPEVIGAGAAITGGERIGIPGIIKRVGDRLSEVGLSPDELRLKDMAPQIEKLQGHVDELQHRVDLASKTSSGYVPDELKSQLEKAQDALRDKRNEAERVSPMLNSLHEAVNAPPAETTPVQGKPAVLGKLPVAADSMPVKGNPAALRGVPTASAPEAPFMTQMDERFGLKPSSNLETPARPVAPASEAPFMSRVEGMVNKADGKPMPPVKGADLSIPEAPKGIEAPTMPGTQGRAVDLTQHEPINPNLSAQQARERLQNPSLIKESKAYEQQMLAKPSAAAKEGMPGVSIAKDVEGEQHPVKIVYDEHGIPTAETDGRHRVIQAIERGDQRIEVTVDRGNGPVKTTYDPKKLAAEMGVTKESLANTDAQQSYRKGGLQPREAVTKGNGSMVNRLGDEVERGLGGEPGIKQGVPMKDQFKSNGNGMTSEKPVVKETSSRPETQAFIDHGMSKVDGANLTKSLDRINNAKMGEFAAQNGVDMGQNSVSRGQGGKSINRGAIVKDLLTRMTPEQIHAAVEKYVGKK